MNSPLAAMTWEMWQRGRRAAALAGACLAVCVAVSFLDKAGLGFLEGSLARFSPFFGLLMVLSFLFLMSVFNYTEYNPSRNWNGFPYRLFTLPVPAWQLAAFPLIVSTIALQAVYWAWIKLVWTANQIPSPLWFGTLLGAYMIFYQVSLWGLAGFRILRVIALSLGGVSLIGIACLPFSMGSDFVAIEKYLVPIGAGIAGSGIFAGCAVVARQRSGGGRRRNWSMVLSNRIMELVPRRRHDFSSLARAQFWFEWRRSGWLLPVCAAFVLAVIFFPISWFWRRDASYGDYIFGRLLAMPLFLALLIGKAFVKCDFWSPRLALPQFLAVRPMSAEQFVAAKLKVAAWSVAISWLLVLIFTVSWLCGWANTKQLHQELFTLRAFFPRAWPLFAVSALAVLMVLTWRCLISGLWAGLSGNLFRYMGTITAQVMVPAMVLLAIGIWSDQIDQLLQKHPQLMKPLSSQALGWVMALLVIARVWFAFAFWKKTSERLTHQYLLTWLVATLAFLAVAFLFRPPFDTYRESHLYLLAALLIFPLARPGLASYAFSLNRHR